jgi:hypothetical protein
MEIVLQNVRLSFPDLFKPRAFQPGMPEKYKATFLVPKADKRQIKIVEDAILEEAKLKWPKNAEKMIASIRGNANKFNWQDGETKDYDGYEGMMSLAAGSLTRPLVIDRDKSPLTSEDGKPYAGCYVNAKVDIFAYDSNGNKGVSAKLLVVQFVKDGESFGGGKPPSADDMPDLGVDEEEEALV